MFCYSNMTSDVKEQVSAIIEKLGTCNYICMYKKCSLILLFLLLLHLGSKIVSNWSSSCTHLVMTAVTITAKVSIFLFSLLTT